MFRCSKLLGLIFVLIISQAPIKAHAGCIAVLFGCNEAKVTGLEDVANSIEVAAEMVENLPEDIRVEAEILLREADARIYDQIKNLKQIYGEALDETNANVKIALENLQKSADSIIVQFEGSVVNILRRAECSASNFLGEVRELVWGKLSLWQRLSFWSSEARQNIHFADGTSTSITYVKGDDASKAHEIDRSYEHKLQNIDIDTELDIVDAIAQSRVISASAFVCKHGHEIDPASRSWQRLREANEVFVLLRSLRELN